jgi:hypothetical protein
MKRKEVKIKQKKIEPKKFEKQRKGVPHPLFAAYSCHVLLRPIENKQMSSIDLLQGDNLVRQERIKL